VAEYYLGFACEPGQVDLILLIFSYFHITSFLILLPISADTTVDQRLAGTGIELASNLAFLSPPPASQQPFFRAQCCHQSPIEPVGCNTKKIGKS
jgi:hypothetical protein